MDVDTYKVAVVNKYTSNAGDITIAELPRQHPTDTQVEITVHAAALNPLDFKRAEGMLAIVLPEAFPLKLGYDVAGTVSRVGKSVMRFKAGDRVYGRVEQRCVGTVAELAWVDESSLAAIPEAVPFTVAAGVGLAGLTAKQALENAGLEKGQTVFVTGGLGGVGMFAVMLAKHHFGAGEIITTVSTSKAERARELGATRVVDYTQERDYARQLENTADVGLDTIGDSSIARVVKPQGSVVSVAMLPNGRELDKFRDPSARMSAWGAFKLGVAKRVVDVVGWFLTRPFRAKEIRYRPLKMHPDGRDLEQTFNPLLADGRMKPAIANIYAFTIEGVQKAFTEAVGGHAAGKIIICVKD
ncbi:hypothetical protein IWW55_002179 [Coemansia sp. RSA 2706]|nr:hypothetical protein IWW55_002179 [Coemansia sp. RSA 2706]KAJ2318936.1 hypothetical protein IWW52_002262 [Coemansia sp. RSA 2704]KAJ2327146.1 hypothetical protein IWW51_001907 [Coemansia sp. RSA 2702]